MKLSGVFGGILAAAALSAASKASAASASFTNPAQITIGDAATAPVVANPYPSNIIVSGLGVVTITKLTVTINDFRHHFPDDVDMMLVGPAGQKMIIWSDVGGSSPVGCTNEDCSTSNTGVTITLDDAAHRPE